MLIFFTNTIAKSHVKTLSVSRNTALSTWRKIVGPTSVFSAYCFNQKFLIEVPPY